AQNIDQVMDLTGGQGAPVVLDFERENGTEDWEVQITRNAGPYFVIGYGAAVHIHPIDIISREINDMRHQVGSYNNHADRLTLAAQGKVGLATPLLSLANSDTALSHLDGGELPRGRAILVPEL